MRTATSCGTRTGTSFTITTPTTIPGTVTAGTTVTAGRSTVVIRLIPRPAAAAAAVWAAVPAARPARPAAAGSAAPATPPREADMERHTCTPRPDWQSRVEAQGLAYHTIDDQPYWDESAFYQFRSAEIDE